MNKGNIELERLLEHFLLAASAEGKSEATMRWYQESVGAFRHFLVQNGAPTILQDLDLFQARAFVAHLRERRNKFEGNPFAPTRDEPLSSHTVQGRVRALRAFFNWLYHEGYTEEHRLQELKVPRVQKKVIEILTQDEIDRLLSHLDQNTALGCRNRAIVVTLLDTGLRCGELAKMKFDDARLEQGILRVVGKGNKERVVPVGKRALKVLLRYRDFFREEPASPKTSTFFLSPGGVPMTVRAVQEMLHRLGVKAAVPRLHAHLLRHTFATLYLINGGDVFSLQRILGHTTLSMVSRYVNLAQSHVALQHRRFSPMDSLDIREPRATSPSNGRGRPGSRKGRNPQESRSQSLEPALGVGFRTNRSPEYGR